MRAKVSEGSKLSLMVVEIIVSFHMKFVLLLWQIDAIMIPAGWQ